jgi:hypothetical protein
MKEHSKDISMRKKKYQTQEEHSQSHSILEEASDTGARTVMRCSPHRSQSCLSFTGLASHEGSSTESGLTRSVMMYTVPSASTASMNLRMSG